MVNINGWEWRLFLVSPNHPQLKRSNGTYAIGACDSNIGCIYINDSLDSQLTKKVLCHELTHAAMFSYDIDLTYDQEELIADLIATYGQEIICMTYGVFKHIKKNKGT